jgi:hypothetical protein
VLGLVAGGSSMVYATAKSCHIGYGCHGIDTGAGFRVTAPQLWSLDNASREPRLIATGRAALVPAAVGEVRVVVITPAGRVVLVGLGGGRLERFRFKRGSVLAARVSGDRLVLLRRNGFVEDWSVSRKVRRRRWPAWSQASTPPLLEGAQGHYAVYVAGMTIHALNLSNGDDRVIPLPEGGEPLHAELTSHGLFYSYRELGARRSTRIVFVPWQVLRYRKS